MMPRKFKGQAHRLERQQQVGKNDGGVDSELFRGGDRDFGGDLGLLADFDKRMVLADVAVLLHVAARLAQKPDWGAVDGPAQTGTDKTAAVENGVTCSVDGWSRVDGLHILSILTGPEQAGPFLNHGMQVESLCNGFDNPHYAVAGIDLFAHPNQSILLESLLGHQNDASYFASTCRTRISGYAPSQSGETASKISRKSRSAPGASGAAETGSRSM